LSLCAPVFAVPYRRVEGTLGLSDIDRNAWKVD